MRCPCGFDVVAEGGDDVAFFAGEGRLRTYWWNWSKVSTGSASRVGARRRFVGSGLGAAVAKVEMVS